MRSCRFFAIVFLSLSALASDLTVKVTDPQSAAVSGAQVEVFSQNSDRATAISITDAQGVAQFHDLYAADMRVHVLAPGFAEQWGSISNQTQVTVTLTLAVATETVVVSATRSAAPGDESGVSIDLLSGAELATMRPVAATEALRFLP